APGAVTVIGPLVAAVRPLLLACSVYPLPTALIVSPANVATPLTALTVNVPPSVAPPGLLASDSVTGPLKLLLRLPKASWASTVSPNPPPLVTTPGGPDVIESCETGKPMTLKTSVVVSMSPSPPTTKPYVPGLSIVRPL